MRLFFAFLLSFQLVLPAAAASLKDNLPPPGQWSLLPGTAFLEAAPLLPEDRMRALGIRGNNGPRAVLDGWAGGAWSPEQRCMFFFGGGHHDYGGNEVYRFCLDDMVWSRLTEPTPLQAGPWGEAPVRYTRDSDKDGTPDACPVPKDAPFATHTYDTIIHRDGYIYLFESSGFCDAGGSAKAYSNWRMPVDPALYADGPVPGESVWERVPDIPAGQFRGHTAINPHTGDIVLLGKGPSIIVAEYDPESGTYPVSEEQYVGYMQLEATCLTAADEIYCFQAKGKVRKPTFDAEGRIEGAGPMINVYRPKQSAMHSMACLAYHPGRDSIIAFPGDREVFEFDRRTLRMTEWSDPDGPAPAKAADKRAFGKARVLSKCAYLPEHDVFMMVRDPYTPVALYRLPEEKQAAGGPVPGLVKARKRQAQKAADTNDPAPRRTPAPREGAPKAKEQQQSALPSLFEAETNPLAVPPPVLPGINAPAEEDAAALDRQPDPPEEKTAAATQAPAPAPKSTTSLPKVSVDLPDGPGPVRLPEAE